MTLRVLVVDDDEAIRAALVRILEELGCQVDVAGDGVQGFEKLSQTPPDLVFTDLEMPNRSGLDLLRWMQRDKIGVPVLAISGHERGDLLGEEAIKLGALEFVPKPFDVEQIREVVARLLPSVPQAGASDVRAVAESPGIAGRRILVVDDDANVRRTLDRFLTERGFAVQTAVNGAAGLEAIRADPPDVVLLDIEMPETDGLDVLDAIRNESLQVGGVLMISGADLERAKQSLQRGAADFITKPFDLDYLEASLLVKLATLGD